MILYHGSNTEIQYPDIQFSRLNVDFGKGFYTTPILTQAENWCQKFKRRGQRAILNQYQFCESESQQFKILRFESYSESWLDFILECRNGQDQSDYDMVIGGVANDKVFNTVELYFDGLIDKTEALKRLKFEEPNLQICFRNQEMIEKCLEFERSALI